MLFFSIKGILHLSQYITIDLQQFTRHFMSYFDDDDDIQPHKKCFKAENLETTIDTTPEWEDPSNEMRDRNAFSILSLKLKEAYENISSDLVSSPEKQEYPDPRKALSGSPEAPDNYLYSIY